MLRGGNLVLRGGNLVLKGGTLVLRGGTLVKRGDDLVFKEGTLVRKGRDSRSKRERLSFLSLNKGIKSKNQDDNVFPLTGRLTPWG